jgi:hypothetical protein
MPYAELEIFIQRLPDGQYAVDLRFRQADGATDSDLASNVPITLDLTRLKALATNPAAYGRALTQMAFADPILVTAWSRVRGFAEGARVPIRMRMRLDANAPELHGIRWETLYDPERDQPLGSNENYLYSRYIDSGDMSRISVPNRDAALALVVVASPDDLNAYDLPPFDSSAEAERITTALHAIPTATLISNPTAPPVTMQAIIEALRYGYTMLFIVCHGRITNGEPFLFLENEQSQVEPVSGNDLVHQIANLPPQLRPTLIVFVSCQSVGTGYGSDIPSALGPQLARAGVGAVIGMQGNLPIETEARLIPRFCRELAATGEVDQALAVARSGLDPRSPWWMPVLFLRLRDGKIWREPVALPQTAAAIAAPSALQPRLLWGGGILAVVLLLILTTVLLMSRPAPSVAEPSGIPVATSGSQSAAVMVVPPEATTTPTSVPSPTLPPTATPVPTIQPVAAGRALVLLAELEMQEASDRNYTADVFDDLVQNLETLSFSNIAVRRYPLVINTSEQAQQAAVETGASVVLWGRNVSGGVDLRVQRGDWQAPGSTIPSEISAAMLDRTANVRLQLRSTDSKLTSAAFGVLAALNVLGSATGDNFAILQVATLQERLQGVVVPAQPTGLGASTQIYNFVTTYYTKPELALEGMSSGITDDPDNPLLYIYRATALQRLDQLRIAADDLRTAFDLVPNWPTVYGLQAVFAARTGDLAQAQQAMSAIIVQRPDDWFAWGYRGGINYLLDDLAAARSDVERAIALNPQTAQPYGISVLTALR